MTATTTAPTAAAAAVRTRGTPNARLRAWATRATCKYAAAGEMCGSSPLPDVVTRSIGSGPACMGCDWRRELT